MAAKGAVIANRTIGDIALSTWQTTYDPLGSSRSAAISTSRSQLMSLIAGNGFGFLDEPRALDRVPVGEWLPHDTRPLLNRNNRPLQRCRRPNCGRAGVNQAFQASNLLGCPVRLFRGAHCQRGAFKSLKIHPEASDFMGSVATVMT